MFNMRSHLALTLILFLIETSNLQAGFLYDQKGQLYLDSNLSISQNQLDVWNRAEMNVIAFLSDVKYPPIYWENGIKPKGPIIASFECDTLQIFNIAVLNDTSEFGKVIENKMVEAKVKILKELIFQSKVCRKDFIGKYYLAFDFRLIDFYKELNDSKAVPIIQRAPALIDNRMH